MIRNACNDDAVWIKELWRAGFGDSQAFLDYYFGKFFEADKTCVYCDGDVIAGSVQTRSAELYTDGKKHNVAYVFGVVTREDYRRRGIARELIARVCGDEYAKGAAAIALIPTNAAMFEFYGKQGFVDVFAVDESVVTYAELPAENASLEEEYTLKRLDFVDFSCIDTTCIYDFQQTAYMKTGLCVLSGHADFTAYVSSFLWSGGALYSVSANDTVTGLAFVAAQNENEPHIKELLARDAVSRDILIRAVMNYCQTDAVKITVPVDAGVGGAVKKRVPFGMLRVLNNGIDIPECAGYMNMMLND